MFFEADGTRYLVVEDRRNDKRILQQLKAMKNGESYLFTGDIISQRGVSAEVTIRNMESLEATENELLMNRLVGKWRSLDDANVVVNFASDFTKREDYGNDVGSHELIEFTKTCKDPQVRPSDEKLLQTFGPSDPDNVFCYEIIENTYDRLTLMYLPRGNFLEYKRE